MLFERTTRGTLCAVLTGAVVLTVQPVFGAGKGPEKKASAAKEQTKATEGEKQAKSEGEVQNKLLKWTTLADAFRRAERERALRLRQIIALQRKLKTEKEEGAKKKIQEALSRAQTAYRNLSVAMSVLFAVNPLAANYVYNPVNSNVYLQVGTLPQVFARAVRVRDRLAQYIGEQQALKEAEKDKKKQDEIQKRIDAAVRQYRLVAAALQLVFGVVPQRSYQYDPKSATLYLKVSDQELEKLRKQLQELREKRAKAAKEKAGAAEEKKPAAAAPKKTK